jgi:hypothetical protein
MFTVQWFVRGQEAMPLETETFSLNSAAVIVQCRQIRLTSMRQRHRLMSPDRSVVFNAGSKEVGRWFLRGR